MVFVIDCNDEQRIELAKQELLKLSKKIDGSCFIPIIIAANKQDLSSLLQKKTLFFFYLFNIIFF